MALQDKYDALIIPGGMGGAVTMAGSTEVQNLVGTYYNHPEKRIIGMICAGMLLISTGCHLSFMKCIPFRFQGRDHSKASRSADYVASICPERIP